MMNEDRRIDLMGKCRRLEKKEKGSVYGGGKGWSPVVRRGGEESGHQEPSPRYSSGNFASLRKAWVNALIPALPWNLGYITSFTATRTMHLGTAPVLASSPSSAELPVQLPDLRKTALQSPPRFPLRRSLPIISTILRSRGWSRTSPPFL